MALIETKNLEKTYYSGDIQTPVLRGISIEIEKGEFLAIMGPSGSGKSTLLHILGFLDRPTRGSYHFLGKSINDYSSDELALIRNRKMGFVFQAFNLLPRISVLENVKLPLIYANIPDKERTRRAIEAVEAVGLSHRLDFDSSRLSGGEKQRVAIARALVNKPDVIFADEPTGNLDSKSGQAVIEIIKKLNDEDKHTVILITHETSTAKYAKRIIKLKDGEIESDKEVKNRNHSALIK